MSSAAVEARISAHHDTANCSWCRKERECVTVTITGFLAEAPVCFRCLQQAIRVRAEQALKDRDGVAGVVHSSLKESA
jgi:hypothetical protein